MPSQTLDGNLLVAQIAIDLSEEARAFLRALYAQMPPGSKLLIWTLPEKRSFWCDSVEAAVEVVENVRGKSNVYFGIGLLGKDFGPTRRGDAADRIAIPALWADFDIANAAAHRKGNLPPSREAILDLLKEAGLPPTISINSGHGLQSYWLFNELWQFASGSEDQQAAETLVRRWNYTLRDLARKKGWDVDSTFDLARVYRVPGTMNRKVENHPVPVEIIHTDGPTYNPADFDPYLIAEDLNSALRNSKGKDYSGVQIAEDLTLDPAATVDMELFELLAEADPRFAASWNRKRRDFADQSGSSYDMSLATIAAQVGWSDQQIVNLLIHHRRKHKDDLKLRLNYYRLTLFNARKGIAKDQAIERLNEMLHEEPNHVGGEPDFADVLTEQPAEANKPSGEQEAKRETILRHISDVLGFDITNIIKYVSSQPTYRLVTPHGSIDLGDVNGLIKQEALRKQVAALMGFHLPRFKPNMWDTIAQSLLNACEEQSAGEEATGDGETKEWLRLYLREHHVRDTSWDEDQDGQPFTLDGRPYFQSWALREWLKRRLGVQIATTVLATKVKMLGCHKDENRRFQRRDGTTTRPNLWTLPDNFEW